MGEAQTLALGVVAGGTILLGLPLGRWRRPPPAARQLLNALAIGILMFLFWDVLANAWEPVAGSLAALHDRSGGVAPVVANGGLLLLGVAVGLLSLVYYERWFDTRAARRRFGPGGMDPRELAAGRGGVAEWAPARRLALLIAIGIGMHNFGEGLAIGSSAAVGAIGLATVLVVGFALHNATEGFGIVAPLAAQGDRPSWPFLLLMGTIGGAPTFLGTVIGRQFTSDALRLVFLTLAAGSILYVIIQLLGVAQRGPRKDILYWGILFGLGAGFLTDMVVTVGGA